MGPRLYVGVDGARPSLAALGWALDRAALRAQPVVLVHVAEDDLEEGSDAAAEEARRRGTELLAGLVRRAREQHPLVDVSTLLRRGNVAWYLASVAGPDDTMVVGSHKTGFIHGRVLGSRSVQVAAGADCSVAVIPDVGLKFRRGVVAGIPSPAEARPIARAAAAEAKQRGESLLLVHSAAPRLDQAPRVDTGGLHVAAAAARDVAPGIAVEIRISERPPAEALLNLAADSALLVLGAPHASELHRNPIGTVIHQVLMNLNVPVLIIPEQSPAA